MRAGPKVVIMRGIAAGLLLAAAVSLAAPAPAQVFDGASLAPDQTQDTPAAAALYKKGSAAYAARDYDGAIALFTQVIAERPQAAVAWAARAMAYDKKGDFDHALADYNQALTLKPNDAYHLNARGMLYRAQKKCDLANADFRQALALNAPLDAPISHSGLAICRTDAKDYAGAIDEYDQAIRLIGNPADPNLAIFYADRAATKWFMKDYPGAIADYTSALDREPKAAAYAAHLIFRARAYRMVRNFDAAIADYGDAIAIGPNAGRYYERGTAHYQNKAYDDAMADFDQALTMNPNQALTAYIHRARGDVWVRRKDFDHALADINQAVSLAPNNPVMLDARCWARGLLNREIDAAIADCEAAQAIRPDNPYVADNLAFAWFRKGAFDKAIAGYDAALKLNPTFAGEVYYHRGLALSASGDKTAGAADIAHALALDPHAGDEMKDYGIAP